MDYVTYTDHILTRQKVVSVTIHPSHCPSPVALEDLGKIFGEENDRETNSVRDDDAWDIRMGTTLQDAKMPRWAWGDGVTLW